MSDRSFEFEEDLAAWRFRRQERAVSCPTLRRFVAPEDASAGQRTERDERLEDYIREPAVAAAFGAARTAPAGPEGEAARQRFRLLTAPFLCRAVVERQAELDRRRASLELPERGFEFEIVGDASPAGRRAIHERWSEYEASLEDFRAQRTLTAVDAARGVGADSLCDFLAAGQPVAAEPLCQVYGATAIVPLDEAVERAARDARLRSPLPLSEPEHPADSPMLACLAGYGDRFSAAVIPTVLRVLGASLGMDPDGDGPGVVVAPEACLRPRPWITRPRPLVLIGALEGPGALVAALDAFGQVAHHSFVAGLRGPASAMTADPAFQIAAGSLLSRLVRCPAFRNRFGPRPDPALDADLRLQAALAPRLAWTYVCLAARGREDEARPVGAEARRALRRALGRPAAVDQCLVPYACDPRGVDELRGVVLALLLEERLLSRWGREWFVEGRAGRYLKECWEAEDGQTAESVANVLDLGTIEPTPLLDGCRP